MVDLIICTYNRAEILRSTLMSIVPRVNKIEDIKLIVVDNNSIDHTQNVVDDIKSLYNINIKLIFEEQIGLSYARNAAAMLSEADWIGYLDDDLFIEDGFFKELITTIKSKRFDAFGGKYLPWFKYGKPKWFPLHYEENTVALEVSELGKSEIWGACMFFKRTILLQMGLFPLHLGMSGNRLAYGEESFIINRMKQEGYRLGLNPNLIIHHLVPKSKLKFSWHIYHIINNERDRLLSMEMGLWTVLKITIRDIIIVTPVQVIKAMVKWMVRKNYYKENFILESLNRILLVLGRIKYIVTKYLFN